MKIIVCLKEVPGRETRYGIGPAACWISEENVTFEISECDEYALEEGLKLKETHGGEVVILTVGRSRAEKVMRKALAMGADRGILIQDEQRRLDSPFPLGAAMAKVLCEEDFDLILTGTQSDDYGYSQVGVTLAELLGVPHATLVMETKFDGVQSFKVLREMESGWFQWLRLPSPALLTIQAGISSIRYPSLKGIMQAKRKEIRKIPESELNLDSTDFPRLSIESLYLPEQGGKVELLEGDPETVSAQLVERLQKEAKVL